MILANTYHLAVRPGEQTVRQLGGLHAFSGWSGPMLTDSGGFQIFSLAQRARVTDEGVSFRSHVDGAALHLSPERVVAIQEALGSDIAMVLDHVVSLPSAAAVVQEACRRTICWAERSLSVTTRADQALFGIVQGGDVRATTAGVCVAAGQAGLCRICDWWPECWRNTAADGGHVGNYLSAFAD